MSDEKSKNKESLGGARGFLTRATALAEVGIRQQGHRSMTEVDKPVAALLQNEKSFGGEDGGHCRGIRQARDTWTNVHSSAGAGDPGTGLQKEWELEPEFTRIPPPVLVVTSRQPLGDSAFLPLLFSAFGTLSISQSRKRLCECPPSTYKRGDRRGRKISTEADGVRN